MRRNVENVEQLLIKKCIYVYVKMILKTIIFLILKYTLVNIYIVNIKGFNDLKTMNK